MHAQERMSLAAIAIGAGVCDRKLDDKERLVVNGILNELKLSEEERGLVYRKVFFSTTSLGTLVKDLPSSDSSRKARGLARKVCEADGTLCSEEVDFLKGLEEENDGNRSSAVCSIATHSLSTEQIVQYFARLSEAVRNKPCVAGGAFQASLRMQLVFKMRRSYRAGKKAEVDELRMIFRLAALSLVMRTHGVTIAHSDSPFYGKTFEIPDNVNEGFADYLVTYAFGCLLQEYYENPQPLSAKALRGAYIAAMLRGRFTRDSQNVPSIARRLKSKSRVK